MGRAYASELRTLSETYNWAIRTPIDQIAEFAKRSAGIPLYAVGSGGSASAAMLASTLHRQTGTIAECCTPLEFLENDGINSHCAVMMITAGGNNEDILSAFDWAIHLKTDLLGILCVSTDNKLIHKALEYPDVLVQAARLPIGKDGFLATNSLLATTVWLTRAYANGFSFLDDLPNSSRQLLYDGVPEEFEIKIVNMLSNLEGRDTIVVLHDSWGKTAAIDAESKFTEAGLVSVQLADYRNFAHGRHNWLDKNGDRTGVIALVTPRYSKLATRTLNLIPKSIPVVELRANSDGPTASLNLLVKIMYAVKFFGDVQGIDPGKPKVAEFGRKMYHLRIPRNRISPSDHERSILIRKFPNLMGKASQIAQKAALLRKYVCKIERTRFGGLALDYDGTICDHDNRSRGPSTAMGICLTRMLRSGILVGVATGRGRSVRDALRGIIPKACWRQLLIGYYNGADLGYLDDDSIPDTDLPTDPNLVAFLEDIKERGILRLDHKVNERPMQISIFSSGMITAKIISAMSGDPDHTDSKVRIVESDHSIDIIPKSISKTNLLAKMQKEMKRDNLQILCIGDKGRWPGNDYDMLKTGYSLSVDEVSEDGYSCWNTLPADIRGERGTLEYLRGARVYNPYFMIRLGVRR